MRRPLLDRIAAHTTLRISVVMNTFLHSQSWSHRCLRFFRRRLLRTSRIPSASFDTPRTADQLPYLGTGCRWNLLHGRRAQSVGRIRCTIRLSLVIPWHGSSSTLWPLLRVQVKEKALVLRCRPARHWRSLRPISPTVTATQVCCTMDRHERLSAFCAVVNHHRCPVYTPRRSRVAQDPQR